MAAALAITKVQILPECPALQLFLANVNKVRKKQSKPQTCVLISELYVILHILKTIGETCNFR